MMQLIADTAYTCFFSSQNISFNLNKGVPFLPHKSLMLLLEHYNSYNTFSPILTHGNHVTRSNNYNLVGVLGVKL